jgi:hypothetical protein
LNTDSATHRKQWDSLSPKEKAHKLKFHAEEQQKYGESFPPKEKAIHQTQHHQYPTEEEKKIAA